MRKSRDYRVSDYAHIVGRPMISDSDNLFSCRAGPVRPPSPTHSASHLRARHPRLPDAPLARLAVLVVLEKLLARYGDLMVDTERPTESHSPWLIVGARRLPLVGTLR
jgi:hypothetical protein